VASNTKFSGWQVLICCFLVMFFIQGGIQAFAVFMPAIIKDTGFTLSEVSLISTIATVVAFAGNMSFGFLLKRLSAKTILFIGAFICSGQLLLISVAESLTGLYIAAFCAGLAIALGTVAPVSVIMTNWFVRRRATYMSIVIAGSMFGGALIMPLVGQLIHHFDWRVGNRVLSLAVALVTFTAILGFLSDHPAKKGQKPYGEGEAELPEAGRKDPAEAEKTASASPAGGVSLAEARTSVSFWLLLTGIFLVGCSTNIENFLPKFWQDEGMSVPASTGLMGFYAFMTGICTILLGRVSDRLGGRIYISLTTFMFLLGTFLIYRIGAAAAPLVILAAIPFAAGAKKTSTLTPPLAVAETFGRKHYGAIIGYFAGVLQLGIAVSNPVIGRLHASSGNNFKVPFMVMGGLSLLAFILIQLALAWAPVKKKVK
jgi:MFS family permease